MRARSHLIDKEVCLQVVLNLASQPLTLVWMETPLAGTLKRARGQETGVTSAQLNISKRLQILLRYGGEGVQKHQM